MVGKEEKKGERKVGGWEGSCIFIFAVNSMHPDGDLPIQASNYNGWLLIQESY